MQQVAPAQAQPATLEAAKASKAERSKMIRARAFKAVIAGALVLIAISGFKIASALNYQSCIEVAGMKYGTASASSLAGVARRNAVAECSGGIL